MAAEKLDFSDAYSDIVLEFLEAAIHQILFIRSVYPSGFFERRQKYGIIVQMCNQKILNDYIKNVLDGISVLLRKTLLTHLKGSIDRVELVILQEVRQPLESYFFAITKHSNVDIHKKGQELDVLKEQFKGALLRIAVSKSLLSPHPAVAKSEELSFEIKLHARSKAVDDLQETPHFHAFPWMSADSLPQPTSSSPSSSSGARAQKCSDPVLVPLKSLTTSLLTMQVYVKQFGSSMNPLSGSQMEH